MKTKTIEIESKENYATTRNQPTRIKTIESEMTKEGKIIIRTFSQKRNGGKPSLTLELDVEGKAALLASLGMIKVS